MTTRVATARPAGVADGAGVLGGPGGAVPGRPRGGRARRGCRGGERGHGRGRRRQRVGDARIDVRQQARGDQHHPEGGEDRGQEPGPEELGERAHGG